MATLQKGSKGKPVVKLQEMLNKAGAKPRLETDGDFGPATETAVKAFQGRAGLRQSGKADRATQEALAGKGAGGGKGGGVVWPVDPKAEMDATFAEVYSDSRRERHERALAMKAERARLEGRLARLRAEIEKQATAYVQSDEKLEALFPQFRKKLFDYIADKEMFEKIRDVDPARARKLAGKAGAKHEAAHAVLKQMDVHRDRQNAANEAYCDAVKPLERL